MKNKATAKTTYAPIYDRVRENTSEEVNMHIDRETEAHVYGFAARSKEEITQRIEELDQEWDMERLLETNAAILALFGLGMAAAQSKKWLILPGVVFSFFLQHAVQGWCPPVPAFRHLGVRTRQEIDREKYALKVLRGDFEGVSTALDTSIIPEVVMASVSR